MATALIGGMGGGGGVTTSDSSSPSAVANGAEGGKEGVTGLAENTLAQAKKAGCGIFNCCAGSLKDFRTFITQGPVVDLVRVFFCSLPLSFFLSLSLSLSLSLLTPSSTSWSFCFCT